MNKPYDMVLCMVRLDEGLTVAQIGKIAAQLRETAQWIPIDFHDNNTSAFGFVEQEYFDSCGGNTDVIATKVNGIIGDWDTHNPEQTYAGINDGLYFINFFE